MNQRLWRLAGAGITTIGVLLGAAATATAANTNGETLTATCDNGITMTVEISGGNGQFPSGLRVIDSTSVFTIHAFTLTSHETGKSFSIKNADGVARNKDLVSCSRSGQSFDFTWTGFFTPAA